MANENKMQDVIATSLQNIKNLIDTNTVIGTPIVANGTTIIPISKVSMAYATGGLDYAGKTDPSKEPKNFGAGGGTGLTMQPLGFLIVDAGNNLQLVLGNTAVRQKVIGHFFAAAALFAQNQRLA